MDRAVVVQPAHVEATRSAGRQVARGGQRSPIRPRIQGAGLPDVRSALRSPLETFRRPQTAPRRAEVQQR